MSNKILKNFYFIIAVLLSYVKKSPFILAFHRVKEFENNVIDNRIGVIEPEIFVKVIDFLQKIGYRFVTLDEMISIMVENRSEKVSVLTFDDGYKDLYTNVYPVLRSRNIPFTLFLTTSTVDSIKLLWMHKLYLAIDELKIDKGNFQLLARNISLNSKATFDSILNDVIMHLCIDDVYNISELLFKRSQFNKEKESDNATNLYLTSHEIVEMLDHGLQVELHSHMHHPCSKLRYNEIEEDLKTSLQFIQKKFDKLPGFWCLPFGIKNDNTRNVAIKFKLKGIISGPSSILEKNTDIFNLPRIEFNNTMSSFYKKLSKAYIKSLIKKKLML